MQTGLNLPWAQGYKTFFMLSKLEHEIYNLNKYQMQTNEAITLLVTAYNAAWPEHTFEPQHEISNNVVCATSKASDQPALMRSLIRAFASCLNIL